MRPIWSHVKVFTLMAGLTAMLGVAGQAAGGPTGLGVALAFAGVTNIALYFWSPRLVLRMYGARVVSDSDAPGLYRAVDRLRRRAGLPMPAVAIAPQAQPNAFATGRSPHHGVVCVTQGLVDAMSPAELDGVLAHELAHIKNRDMLLQTVTATVAGAISNLANLAAFSHMFGTSQDDEGGGSSPVAGILTMVVAPIAAMLVQFAISRQREFAADRLGAEISGQPLALARALGKLESYARQIPMDVAPAAAPLAQVNPLAAYANASDGMGSALARWFSTHPPTAERIARLQAMDNEDPRRRWVA